MHENPFYAEPRTNDLPRTHEVKNAGKGLDARAAKFEVLFEEIGLYAAASFEKGRMYRKIYESKGEKEKERFFQDIIDNNIERAIEVEREAGITEDPNIEYTLKCLSELSSLSLSDVETAREYLNGKVSSLEDLDLQKDLGFYNELARNILDDKGPFFNQVCMFLEANPAIKSPHDVDFLRLVTVRAFYWLLDPLLKTRAAMETERMQSEYRRKALETGEFLKDAFQELQEVDLAARADGLRFEVMSVLAKPPKWGSLAGKYSNGLITLPYQNRMEDQTLVHEIIHGLSDNGKTAGFEDSDLSEDANINLTEAVVEETAFFASEERTDDGYALSYPKQRGALAELRRMNSEAGLEIPLSSFVSALVKHEPLNGFLDQVGFSEDQKKEFYIKANALFGKRKDKRSTCIVT